ncbi:MAG: hypothetical protein AB7F50_07350 [Fimbriimonadaceae bacterium]
MSKAIVAAVVLLGTAVAAVADGVVVDARSNGAQLIVNEVTVYTVRTGRGSRTPASRAQEMAATLNGWDGAMSVFAGQEPKTKTWRVAMGERTVLTATAEEAKAAGTSAEGLAKLVANKLGTALKSGKVSLGQQAALLPPDRAETVRLVGSEARKATVKVTPPGLAKIVRSQGSIQIVPQGTGEGLVNVTGASSDAFLTLRILPYAAKLPSTVAAHVFGVEATEETVARAAQASLLSSLAGKAVRVTELSRELAALAGGSSSLGRVRYRVEANGAFPVEGAVSVQAKNLSASLRSEEVLLYSNDPENVPGPAMLYGYDFEPRKAARLLWHHKNTGHSGLVVEYLLVNESLTATKVRVTMGESEGDPNPTLSGYRAATQFLTSWLGDEATEVTLPPMSARPLIAVRANPGDTVSGLARLEAETPGVRIMGRAVRAADWVGPWRTATTGLNAWARMAPISLSEMPAVERPPTAHVYPHPFRKESFRYQQGGRYGYVRVGEKAIPDTLGEGVLHGNFGVVYDIDGTIENPTSSPAEVEIVFEASAGYTGALFEWGGSLVKAGLLQTKAEYLLSNVKVPPGEQRSVRFKTIPLSGANYPVTIIVRPVGSER